MKQWIKAVGTGKKGVRSLTYDEAVAAAHAIARGDSSDVQTAAFLMALRMKCEADDEIMAIVDVFRSYSQPITSFSNSINCAGPYDGHNYFPVTIPVSLLLASVGVPQVLHSSETFSPKQGTSLKELLESQYIGTNITVQEWEQIFTAIHIGFIWTEQICPPLQKLRHIREQLELRTIINTVEELLNPVHSKNLIIGVNHRTDMEQLVQIVPRAGYDLTYIVQGIEGSEDLPTHKNSTIRKVTPYGDESIIIDPQTFGFRSIGPLEKCTKEEQAIILKRVIDGEESEQLTNEIDHVIFNAGLRLYWFDKVASYEDGFQLARQLMQRKLAKKVLHRWSELSNKGLLQNLG